MGAPVRHKATRAARAAFSLAVALSPDGTPPGRFRLFVAGWNETENGRFLFDAAAAESVMAAYAKWGVDLMIDLEHQSLTPDTPPEPTAKDARGWCGLEICDGELWAVNVTWTEDGAARLTGKRQRYVSPAFAFDEKTRAVTSIFNVAITSIPATHGTPALVAASATGAAMTVEEFLKVCKALGLDMTMPLADAMAKIKGDDPPADPDANTEDAPPPAGDGGADEATEAAEPPPPPAGKKPADPAAAATAAFMRGALALVGKTDPGEALAALTVLASNQAKLDADRKALELQTRKSNAIALTKLGAETPHTSGLATGTLCKRLLDEPLDEQSSRVAALLAARGGKLPSAPVHPAIGGKDDDGSHGLSARELAQCAAKKIDPAAYATKKAAIAARSNAPRASED